MLGLNEAEGLNEGDPEGELEELSEELGLSEGLGLLADETSFQEAVVSVPRFT